MEQFQKNVRGRFKSLAWGPRIALLRLQGKKRVALASYPRSGNTWVRLLLEEATGQQSGTIYGGNEIIKRGSEGIVIKAHGWDVYKYTHAIHLDRDPFDVCVSYFQYSRDIYREKDLGWPAFLKKTIAEWRGHTLRWMRAAKKIPVHRLRYEDLLAAPKEELRQLLDWHGIEVSDAKIAQAVAATQIGSLRKKHPKRGKKFFRKGKSGLGISQFSTEQRSYVAEQLGDLLKDLDYSAKV